MLKKITIELNQSVLDNLKDFFKLTMTDPML